MVTLSFGDLMVAVATIAGFAGVIFNAGKLSARVDSIEEWRRTMPNKLDEIHAAIRDVAKIVRNQVT
jgi:hypothetical protein